MYQKIVSEYLYNLRIQRLSKHDLKGYKTVTEKTGGLSNNDSKNFITAPSKPPKPNPKISLETIRKLDTEK